MNAPLERRIFNDLLLDPEALGDTRPSEAYEYVMRTLQEYPQQGRAYLYAVCLMGIEGGLILGKDIIPNGDDSDVKRVAVRRLRAAIQRACDDV